MLPIQAKSLEMAQYFMSFCQKHQLTCYVCGGGAIGALRHGGFIPWDDDLDFFMPRKDYERLSNLWAQYAKDDYVLSKSNRHYVDRNNFITIRDRQTTCVKPYQYDLDIVHGLALDILPLDVAPSGKWQRKVQKGWALIYSLFCSQVVPEKHGGVLRWGSQLLLGLVPSQRLRYAIWRFAEKRMTRYKPDNARYWVELCSGPYYMSKLYEASWFKEAVSVPFENTSILLPSGYHQYLSEAFGDYMTPPPVEKQVPHHDALILDLERPYTDYLEEIHAQRQQAKCAK